MLLNCSIAVSLRRPRWRCSTTEGMPISGGARYWTWDCFTMRRVGAIVECHVADKKESRQQPIHDRTTKCPLAEYSSVLIGDDVFTEISVHCCFLSAS